MHFVCLRVMCVPLRPLWGWRKTIPCGSPSGKSWHLKYTHGPTGHDNAYEVMAIGVLRFHESLFLGKGSILLSQLPNGNEKGTSTPRNSVCVNGVYFPKGVYSSGHLNLRDRDLLSPFWAASNKGQGYPSGRWSTHAHAKSVDQARQG